MGIAPRKALSKVPVTIPIPAKISAVPAKEKARGDYKFIPRDYTIQQKIWQGKIKKKNTQPVD